MSEDLQTENNRLKAAIRKHRDEKGDDRCWLDDQELYEVLGEGGLALETSALPPKEQFLKSCERFWHQRQGPCEHGNAQLPKNMTIAQLTARVEELERASNSNERSLAKPI